MQSPQWFRIGLNLATSGPVSLTQGVYGTQGNLELVACDSAAGLWVFWFNADHDTGPLETPDVPPGSWSAGLAFGSNQRYVDAQILQSTLGPSHLEVLALTDGGVLQSWYWSPGPGFQRRTADAGTGVTRFGASHDAGTIHITIENGGGIGSHLASPTRDYPARMWLPAAHGPGLPGDATPALLNAGVAWADIEPATARAATSRRGGGTTELTWRDKSGGIRHLAVPLS